MTPAIALHILKTAWPKVRWLLPYLIVAALAWAACDRYHRGATVPSTATAEVRLPDGTVLPARVPGGTLTAPAPTLPKGSKRIAAVQIKVQGGGPILKTPPAAPVTGLAAPSAPVCWDADDFTCPAPTVRIDVAIEDNQYRIAARSADGMLLESIHVPFATLPVLVLRKNRAGIDLYADNAKVIRYERRVLKRFWIGPAALIQPEGFAVPGVTVGGEW